MEPKDVTNAVPIVLDKGLYVAVGMVIVWLLNSGKAKELWAWFRQGRQETREEAKEAPEREIVLLRAQLDEYRLTQKGIVSEMAEYRQKYHDRDVEFARIETELKHVREDLATVKAERDGLKQENVQLRAQLATHDKKIERIEVKVAQQEQQGK